MNIYVYNCPNTFNYGSMMMGENFISSFNNITGEKNKYYVETDDSINIERLKAATGINEIYAVEQNCLFKPETTKKDYILGYVRLKKIISEFIKTIDLVVILGGDDFTEDYGWKRPIVNGIKFNMLKREGLKVVMLGQTMGPYKSFRKPVMKFLLSKIDKIYPRDPITYNYLDKMGLSNIAITDDLALLTLTKQEKKERTKQYITYCPSELIYRFSKEGNRQDWIDFNLFMIDKLMVNYPTKQVVLLPHVTRPKAVDDSIIANELYALVKDKYGDRIIVEKNEMYPYEVRNYIQQSLFTISSRMHPVVSSIQCEIPAIALSYSSKYWGIIGERYGLGDYIIDVRDLTYDEMRTKFTQLLSNIDLEYEVIQEKMHHKNILANETIRKTLLEIARASF
ncbi:polysaccharide pyruvyl transferase family protein [Clostridium sp.]|uniref:polysaccharide pyruvyl transferase family protein n=1 Tax=Clostridium sp. TaxID=1506 RepID=UPI003D6C90B0